MFWRVFWGVLLLVLGVWAFGTGLVGHWRDSEPWSLAAGFGGAVLLASGAAVLARLDG